MYNIAVIGVGNLGLRHFQALLNCKEKIEIFLVDKSEDSLNRAKSIVSDTCNIQINYKKTIKELPSNLDVVIMATSSNVRAKLIKDLLTTGKTMKYLILEKVLFQKESEYYEIENLLKEKNINAWVNCSRRTYEGYKILKNKLSDDTIKSIVVSGGDWGLGCNSIHMIDLIAYLTSEVKNIEVNSCLLDEEIIGSKRDGFIEFTGTLVGQIDDTTFTITSNKDTNEQIMINIFTNDCTIVVNERLGYVNIITGSRFEKIDLNMKFQSQLSNLYVDKLISTGECDLTSFEESCRLHIPTLNAFLNHIQKQGKGEDGVCSIT